MNWKIVFDFMTQPEVVSFLATVIVAILIKLKIVTEKDVVKAKTMIKKEFPVEEITNVVKMTKPQVEIIKAEMQGPDTNRKKIQRAGRKLLRGWLGF
jgi:hypothetical protein